MERSAKILLVEDDGDSALALSKLLKMHGYTVSWVGRRKLAIDLATLDRFDVLVCDISLPDGNGRDVLEEVRKMYHIDGIALSGYGEPDDIARSHDAGFMFHLVKPVLFDHLRRAIDQVLELRRTRQVI